MPKDSPVGRGRFRDSKGSKTKREASSGFGGRRAKPEQPAEESHGQGHQRVSHQTLVILTQEIWHLEYSLASGCSIGEGLQGLPQISECKNINVQFLDKEPTDYFLGPRLQLGLSNKKEASAAHGESRWRWSTN